MPDTHEVIGSSPIISTKIYGVYSLEEKHPFVRRRVGSSNLLIHPNIESDP